MASPKKGRTRIIPYATLVDEVNSILSQYEDRVTVRQIFYRFVSKGLLESKVGDYKVFDRWVTEAREKGDVDWKRIVDDTRGVYGVSDLSWEITPLSWLLTSWSNFKDHVAGYVTPRWLHQPVIIELWVEKEALRRVIEEATRGYRVLVCPAVGQPSLTYLKEAVERFNKDKPTKILYVGDEDFWGHKIETSLLERLQRYGAKSLQHERIALTMPQIEELHIPKFYDKKGRVKCEVDAIPPDQLQKIVVDALEKNIDWSLWKEAESREEEITDKLLDLVQDLDLEDIVDLDELL